MTDESKPTPDTHTAAVPSKAKVSYPLAAIFSSPRIGLMGTLLGTLIGIVGIVLSIYIYHESREYPQLSYFVHPVKASVLKAGQASKLRCDFEGQSITSDITVAQVAVWNQGKKSIKRDNILKPVVLYLTNGSPILEAILRKQSRDVVNLELDRKELSNGRLIVSWAILEKNDGAIIQLTYAGGPEVPILLDGIVEGQANVERVDYSGKLPSPEEQYRSRTQGDHLFRWILLGMALLLIITSVGLLKRLSPSDRVGFVFHIMGIIIGFAAIVVLVVFRVLSTPLGPPFGFD